MCFGLVGFEKDEVDWSLLNVLFLVCFGIFCFSSEFMEKVLVFWESLDIGDFVFFFLWNDKFIFIEVYLIIFYFWLRFKVVLSMKY